MNKIIYFGNFNKTKRRTIDSEIASSLTNHKVEQFDIKDFKIDELIKACERADLFLFHGTVIAPDDITHLLMVERLKTILMNIKCKKVMWFMDRVWGMKGQVVDALLPLVDKAYFVDETWVRRTKGDNIFGLHPAHTKFNGKYKKSLAHDIIYVGNLYARRKQEYSFLKENFGDRIKFFDDKFDQELADLCASSKIAIIPQFPFDDFYWSERIYEYLNNEILVVCPRQYGLELEGFKDQEHYMTYSEESEIIPIVIEMLQNEDARLQIASNGAKFARQFTYEKRLKEIL